jgi:hypothetical protein
MAAGPDTFMHYQQPILVLASELYLYDRDGLTHYLDIEPEQRTPYEQSQAANRPVMLPPNPGSEPGPRTPEDVAVAEARTEQAARTVAHLALLEDTRERGGPMGIIAAVEIGVTHVIERRRLRGGLGERKAIDAVRGKKPEALAA